MNLTKIYFDKKAYESLSYFLEKNKNLSSIFILVDENTKLHCLPYLLKNIPGLKKARLIEISSGETKKNIETSLFIWNFLTENQADRNSLLINLGGGVICDMGGFAASTYKRGIQFLHIPTTLLSMVDASIGGKTGINLNEIKNQMGVFSYPKFIIVDSFYLLSLSKQEILSGFAEIIKISLVCNKKLFNKLKNINFDKFKENKDLKKIITKSISLKNKIVKKDPLEKGIRKILNFGHTIGHALESYFLESKKNLLHGEAIALGIVAEAYLSYKLNYLEKKQYEEIEDFIFSIYPKRQLAENSFEKILEFMTHDKKNKLGVGQFILLKTIGKANIDCQVPLDLIKESLFYIVC